MTKKSILFISDFDGTATKKDVYLHFLEKYHDNIFKQEINKNSQEKELTCFEYLNSIFSTINTPEQKVLEDLCEVEFDDYLKDFILYIEEMNGDFVIVSAGGACYIEKILAYNGLSHIKFHANKSAFVNNGVQMFHEPQSPFYSYKYGIDKEKIVLFYRDTYEIICYAGDCTPDYQAGIAADYRFAKGILHDAYERDEIDHFCFDTFNDIQKIIEEQILLTK